MTRISDERLMELRGTSAAPTFHFKYRVRVDFTSALDELIERRAAEPATGELIYRLGNELHETRAELIERREASTWRPLGTAPKEGLIDLWANDKHYVGCYWDRICSEYRVVDSSGTLIRLRNATHWMPPQQPPGSAQSGFTVELEHDARTFDSRRYEDDGTPAVVAHEPVGPVAPKLQGRAAIVEAWNDLPEHLRRYGTMQALWRAIRECEDAQREAHHDDGAVDRFAIAMKAKLAAARAKGRGGWDDPAACTVEHLSDLLRGHVTKGDPVDVANFAMMLHQRRSGITQPEAPADAIAAGDGTLHGAIDYWQKRAEEAEAIREAPPKMTEDRILACLLASGCSGTVKLSFETEPYGRPRPSMNADKFAHAIESARDEQWRAALGGGV